MSYASCSKISMMPIFVVRCGASIAPTSLPAAAWQSSAQTASRLASAPSMAALPHLRFHRPPIVAIVANALPLAQPMDPGWTAPTNHLILMTPIILTIRIPHPNAIDRPESKTVQMTPTVHWRHTKPIHRMRNRQASHTKRNSPAARTIFLWPPDGNYCALDDADDADD